MPSVVFWPSASQISELPLTWGKAFWFVTSLSAAPAGATSTRDAPRTIRAGRSLRIGGRLYLTRRRKSKSGRRLPEDGAADRGRHHFAGCSCDAARGRAAPARRSQPRVGRGEGDVPARGRGDARRRGSRLPALRPPLSGRERRRAPRRARPVDADRRRPRRHHARARAPGRRSGPHRRVGARAAPRPPPRRLCRTTAPRAARDRRDRARPRSRRRALGRGGPPGRGRQRRRTLVRRDRRAAAGALDQRGDAAVARALRRVRAGLLHRARGADAAARDLHARGHDHADRRDPRRVRAGPRAEAAPAARRRPLRRLRHGPGDSRRRRSGVVRRAPKGGP